MTNDLPSDPVSDFQRAGFAVIPDLANDAVIGELRTIYDGMIDGSIPTPGSGRSLGGLTRQIMLPHLHHPYFADNPALARAREIARDLLLTDEPYFLFSMLIYKPPLHPHETPWHQDIAYAAKPFSPPGTRRRGNIVAQFWLALDDVDDTMGCMEFIPGEQHRPMPEHFVAAGDPDDDGRLLAMRNPAANLNLAKVVRCPLTAGSATVHGYTTPHRTGPNRSPTRGRRAYIFSFANMTALAAATQDRGLAA